MIRNLELALLTRVIETKNFNALDNAQITEQYFATAEGLEIYRYIKDIYRSPATSGMVPSMDLIRARFPAFYPIDGVTDNVEILAEQLRLEKIRAEIQIAAQRAAALADTDPRAALAELQNKVSNLSSIAEPSCDLAMSGAFDMLKERYETVRNCHGVTGIPYPWDALNEETRGMQKEELVVFFGRPKSGKSWLGAHIASHAYLHSMRRVLYYTREMSMPEIAERLVCNLSGTDYGLYTKARLPPDQYHKVFGLLEELQHDEIFLGSNREKQPLLKIISDKGAPNGGSVSWLRAKVLQYQPDLLIVDGVYLLRDDRSNKRESGHRELTNITQDLKRLAQDFSITVLGLTQANRSGDKTFGDSLNEVSYSDSFAQDCDALWKVNHVDTVDEATGNRRPVIYLTALALRNTKMDGFVVNFSPATDFSYIRSWVKTEDVDLGEKSKPPQRQGPRRTLVPTDPRIPAPKR